MFTKEQNVTYTGSNTATRTTGDEGTVAEDENSVEAQGPELHQESVQEPSQEPQSVSMQPQQEVADEQREE